MYYTDIVGNSYPVKYRLYDKSEGKTKNDYFLEMLGEAQAWGLKPAWVTVDSWYASLENLKFLRNVGVGFLFGVANNRKVSQEKGKELQIKDLEILNGGLVVYLKEFGWVKVFRQDFKHETRYYILHLPDLENLKQISQHEFKQVHDRHWLIESFHRVIKQVCSIERFQVRNQQAIRNHFFCSLRAFSKLQTMRIRGLIADLYEVSRDLFVFAIRDFIVENLNRPLLN
jgi:Transposase DDE domain